jgi:hypothetical protein
MILLMRRPSAGVFPVILGALFGEWGMKLRAKAAKYLSLKILQLDP